jgi:hypothetical protein
MKNRTQFEEDYIQMKNTYDAVVNANIKLSDEKKLVEFDNKQLQRKLDNIEEYVKTHKKYFKKDLLKMIKDY